MILIGVSRFLVYYKTAYTVLGNINKHSIAWETLILKLGQNRLVKKLVRHQDRVLKTTTVPVKHVLTVNRYNLIKIEHMYT